ncbi:MAG: hypothetical protein ABSA05_00360 [Opitutaceae bacterium]|jgi:hypothetical protein
MATVDGSWMPESDPLASGVIFALAGKGELHPESKINPGDAAEFFREHGRARPFLACRPGAAPIRW